tara:strand:+ start:4243 stop:5280 length:1038 start_codon:yes stop_codon:yes gene_type:complete
MARAKHDAVRSYDFKTKFKTFTPGNQLIGLPFKEPISNTVITDSGIIVHKEFTYRPTGAIGEIDTLEWLDHIIWLNGPFEGLSVYESNTWDFVIAQGLGTFNHSDTLGQPGTHDDSGNLTDIRSYQGVWLHLCNPHTLEPPVEGYTYDAEASWGIVTGTDGGAEYWFDNLNGIGNGPGGGNQLVTFSFFREDPPIADGGSRACFKQISTTISGSGDYPDNQTGGGTVTNYGGQIINYLISQGVGLFSEQPNEPESIDLPFTYDDGNYRYGYSSNYTKFDPGGAFWLNIQDSPQGAGNDELPNSRDGYGGDDNNGDETVTYNEYMLNRRLETYPLINDFNDIVYPF